MDELEMTPKEAAAELGVSDRTVRRWAAAGVLKSRLKGAGTKKHHRFITRQSVSALKAVAGASGEKL